MSLREEIHLFHEEADVKIQRRGGLRSIHPGTGELKGYVLAEVM